MSKKVIKSFRFRHNNGQMQDFGIGETVPDHLDNHFFVVHHCENPPASKFIKGSPAYAAEAQRRVAAQMAAEQEASKPPRRESIDERNARMAHAAQAAMRITKPLPPIDPGDGDGDGSGEKFADASDDDKGEALAELNALEQGEGNDAGDGPDDDASDDASDGVKGAGDAPKARRVKPKG